MPDVQSFAGGRQIMRDYQPFVYVCALLCAWPMLWAFAGFMIGRNGLPFQLSERWRRQPKQPPIELKRRESPAALAPAQSVLKPSAE